MVYASRAARRLRFAALACLPALLACVAEPLAANPAGSPASARLTITGLESLGVASASKAVAAKLQFTEKALTIYATGFVEPVSVTPWRKAWATSVQGMLSDNALPSAGGDTAQFFRRREPFGLVQSVFITRGEARLPWLAIQSNAPSGQKVLAGWSVLHSQGKWLLQHVPLLAEVNQAAQGTMTINIGTPISVTEQGKRWCLHTASSLQQPVDAPLIDWLLIQQTRASGACEPG